MAGVSVRKPERRAGDLHEAAPKMERKKRKRSDPVTASEIVVHKGGSDRRVKSLPFF